MRLVVGLRPVSDTLDKPDLGGALGAGGRPSGWHALRCAGAWAGQAGLRWVAGWARPEATRLLKPRVGCWLPGSRTTLWLRLELGLGGLG